MDLSRRAVLSAVAAVPLARLGAASPRLEEAPVQVGPGPFTLPPLPYAYDALERAIDATTMTIHHDRHHAGYVKNLNEAVAKLPPELAKLPLEEMLARLPEIPTEVRAAVRNNGGGHHNHTLFWESMSPTGGGEPKGRAAEIVEKTFGGFDEFKTKFEAAGTGRFGSGWAWLVRNGDAYEIVSRANQDSPLMTKRTPILGNDVWEHAYYLRYQNRRADYLKAWWQVVDWAKVEARIAAAEATTA